MLSASRTRWASARRSLPREARDTLFLLGVVAWLLLPQINHLPLWCSLMAALMLGWRAWLALGSRPLPNRWWLLGALVLTVGATLLNYRTILGRDAGVTLIVVLLALKTLELRARRDAFVVFFLGFFTLLTNFFFSQSLLVAASMLIGLLGLLTALVNAHMPVGKPSLAASARTAGLLALFGAPVMVVLFLLFPRVAPLWGVPDDAGARTGLSASMRVGAFAHLALDEGIAMHIKFDGPVPASPLLYFRGPVLGRFDGRDWLPLTPVVEGARHPAIDLQTQGEPVRYEVTLEPSDRPWLLLLDAAADPPQSPGLWSRQNTELLWATDHGVSELLRYRAQSYTQFSYQRQLTTLQFAAYTELPPGYNPRTLRWAAQLRAEAGPVDAQTLSAQLLQQLRSGGYHYTLDPGEFGPDAADEFWFDRKEGFCEHIASSYVIAMRAMGVPARVVTGYQGGELNRLDGYWVVRNSDAHAWAEIWQSGLGWLRVDPTGAVAPSRIGTVVRLVTPRGAVATALGNLSPTLAADLRAAWDAVNNRWNQWVLNYSQARQLDLLKRLGFEAPSWEDLGYLLAGLLVAASLGGALWTLWERRQHDPWLRLLDQARRRATRAGLVSTPQQPPRQLAQQLQQQFGSNAQTVVDWLLRLERMRYAGPGPGTAVRLRTLQREWRHLRWPTNPPPP